MSLSVINMSEIKSIINNLPFEQVKNVTQELNISVKEKNNSEQSDLYMLVGNKHASDADNIIQNQCNGLILEKGTNSVVSACYNKIVDMELEDFDTITSKSSVVKVEYCEDGTMIRLYNYKGKWYTATARCMDARDSIWASKQTFDELFWENFDASFLDTLNCAYTYVFLLLHIDNRIVVRHVKNELVYVSRIHNETSAIDEDYSIPGFRRPVEIRGFDPNKFEELIIFSKRGVMVKCYNKQNTSFMSYKIDFDQYKAMKHIRGNVPNIRMRFLELLNNGHELAQLEMYYSEHAFLFATIKHALMNLVTRVYDLYVESHIKHSIYVYEPHPYYRTLRQLHAQYKGSGNPITINDVEKKIFSLDKMVLKNLLGWIN
jgi:hypothetical protein